MDVGDGTVFAVAVEVDDLSIAVVLFQTAAFARRSKACDGMGRFLPIETNVAGARETGVFETVIAKDNIELVLNLLGGGIAVLC